MCAESYKYILEQGFNLLDCLNQHQEPIFQYQDWVKKVVMDGFDYVESLDNKKFKCRSTKDILRDLDNLDSFSRTIKRRRIKNLVKASESDLPENVAIINSFPNALLLKDTIFTSNSIQEDVSSETENVDKRKPLEEESIWDIIDRAVRESNSCGTLNNLDSKSESDIDTEDDNYENIMCDCGAENPPDLNHDGSAIVCKDCGKTLNEILDQGPEWRSYNNDENRGGGIERCGGPVNPFFPKSAQGTHMAGPINSRLRRRQKWVSMNYDERSLNAVFEIINSVCIKHKLPKIIIDDAKIFYKILRECRHKSGVNTGKRIIIRGKNRISIIAACVYKACKRNHSPHKVQEIASFFELSEKKVTKGIKQFDKNIKNSENAHIIDESLVGIDTTEDFIRRHCPKLRISKTNTNMAVQIARNCCRMKLVAGHNPESVAAGSIAVMVSYKHLNIDKADIAKLFGTSVVTINKIFGKLNGIVDGLIDDECVDYLIKKLGING